jgi:hypothetical protein
MRNAHCPINPDQEGGGAISYSKLKFEQVYFEFTIGATFEFNISLA